jgi:hypothetical protein
VRKKKRGNEASRAGIEREWGGERERESARARASKRAAREREDGLGRKEGWERKGGGGEDFFSRRKTKAPARARESAWW